jgi:ADP-heptose:LPS heptosyltransferase
MTSNVKKILLFRLSSFGDIVLTFPLVNILRNNFPDAFISFITKDEYIPLISLNPKIDNCISIQMINNNSSNRQVRFSEYDIIIDLQNNIKSKLFLPIFQKNIFRYKKNNFKKFILVLFKINLFSEVIPVYKKYIQSVKSIIPYYSEIFSISDLNFINNNIPAENYIALAPSSKHFTKIYPVENYIKIINNLNSSTFVLLGDNSENDLKICNQISESCKNVINKCGKLSFSELAGVINNSKCVLSNDSGISHLSESLNRKVVAIFGSSIPEFGFAPQLIKSIMIENKEIKCRPCSHIGKPKCPKKTFDCMKNIDYKLIISKLIEDE